MLMSSHVVQLKSVQITQVTGEKEKTLNMLNSKPAGLLFIWENITGRRKQKRMDMFVSTNRKWENIHHHQSCMVFDWTDKMHSRRSTQPSAADFTPGVIIIQRTMTSPADMYESSWQFQMKVNLTTLWPDVYTYSQMKLLQSDITT